MSSGYLFILAQIACSVSFGHIMKWALRRKCSLSAVGAVNYVAASALCLGIGLAGGSAGLTSAGFAVGALGGAAYVVSYFFYAEAIRRTGVSVSSSVNRLAVVPAIVGSIFIWSETVVAHQAIGILLILVALPLLSRQPGGKAARAGGSDWLVLLGLFLTTSGGPLAAKLAQEDGRPEAKPFLLAVWFGVAAAIALGTLAGQRLRPTRADLPLGILLGAANVGGNFALLAALERLPGAIVFPGTSAGGLLCVVVTGALLWGERLSRPALVGVALAVPALALVNLSQ